MSDDWKVGDLAVCVDARNSSVLREGATYRVTAYFFDPTFNRNGVFTEYTLHLAGVRPEHGDTGFCATRFRKIRPDQHEPCEEEFRILLKLSKRRVSA